MTATPRTFIAIELPPHVRQAVAGVQRCMQDQGLKIRWVQPQNIHLTLKFLGQTPASLVDVLTTALGRVAQTAEALLLNAQGLGVFPSIRRPKVIWTGIGGDLEALQKLHQRVDAVVEGVDGQLFPRDKRPFKAHLTLGRVKGKLAPERLHTAMQICRGPQDAQIRVGQICLIKSVLSPQGPHYSPLARFALKGPRGGRVELSMEST